jgi:thiol-disulfide isomerase/thioredoxin
MNRPLLCALIFVLSACCLPAFAGDAAADYAAWKTAYQRSPRDVVPRGDKVAQEAFWSAKAEELDALAGAFVVAHPGDARRWEVMLRAVQMARWLKTKDRASETRHRDWLAQIVATTDVPLDLRDQAQTQIILFEIDAANSALAHGRAVDGRALATQVDRFGDDFPESRNRSRLEHGLFTVLSQTDLAFARERAVRLAAASGPLASFGEDWGRKLGYVGQTIEMKFTAPDGVQVDLANYRGRVVLVDFWATWCGPCMAEMPTVKAVYAKYRDQGFEVIGISLDGGGITKGIQSGVKTTEDFLAFLQREQMPWPQHFTNQGWKNEFAQRFGIKSIPAIFLIGRDGKVVSTEARGESLEPQVRQALGL